METNFREYYFKQIIIFKNVLYVEQSGCFHFFRIAIIKDFFLQDY